MRVMQANPSTQIYTDFTGFDALRREARDDPQASLREVARQFESLYIQMMLKSMRDASLGDPLFDSNSSEVYRDMFDKQMSMQMSRQKGIGLADMLVRQLQASSPAKTGPVDGETLPPRAVAPAAVRPAAEPAQFTSQAEFIEHVWPLAEQAADELGVPPQAILAQAALETGWGKHVSRDAAGRSSYNLFNIKADSRWSGPRVVVDTLEYTDGVAAREKAAFRAYGSYAESVRDYVDFLRGNPRYEHALHNSASADEFAANLQDAGYATDPEYAQKLVNIMQREITGAPQSDYLLATL